MDTTTETRTYTGDSGSPFFDGFRGFSIGQRYTGVPQEDGTVLVALVGAMVGRGVKVSNEEWVKQQAGRYSFSDSCKMKNKSAQEELLNAMSNSVLGANYVFAPPVYSKGNHAREPADLVWACNNCLVLMYMTAKKYKKRSVEAHAQMRKALIEHNLKQARGWIRQWRKDGFLLEGKSESQSFSIAQGDYKHIIVLSVLDCNDEDGTFHAAATTDLDITACATITQESLLNIARMNGSLIELLHLLIPLQAADKAGNRLVNLTDIARANQLKALNEVDPGRVWLTEQPDENTITVSNTIRYLRAPKPNSLTLNTGDWDLGRVLNDLPLSDIYGLTCLVRQGIEYAGPDSKYHCCLTKRFIAGYYIVINVLVLGSRNFLKAAEISPEIESAVKQDGYGRGFIRIIWDSMLKQVLTIAYHEGENKISYTELITDLLYRETRLT